MTKLKCEIEGGDELARLRESRRALNERIGNLEAAQQAPELEASNDMAVWVAGTVGVLAFVALIAFMFYGAGRMSGRMTEALENRERNQDRDLKHFEQGCQWALKQYMDMTPDQVRKARCR